MDGENNGKPYEQMDDLKFSHILETLNILIMLWLGWWHMMDQHGPTFVSVIHQITNHTAVSWFTLISPLGLPDGIGCDALVLLTPPKMGDEWNWKQKPCNSSSMVVRCRCSFLLFLLLLLLWWWWWSLLLTMKKGLESTIVHIEKHER